MGCCGKNDNRQRGAKGKLSMRSYLAVEDLNVYQRLCQLHIEICDLSHAWPSEERYELGSQVRRSSSSSPAQLVEKNDDRPVRNKIEGVNRSRGEAGETVHHLFVARLKGYLPSETFAAYKERYKECVRMLNGLEKTLETKRPAPQRRWFVAEPGADYSAGSDLPDIGWPSAPET